VPVAYVFPPGFEHGEGDAVTGLESAAAEWRNTTASCHENETGPC
jgi:hypothetical protein